MMVSSRTFPYPVLGLQDDVGQGASVDVRDIKISHLPQSVEIEYTLYTLNTDFYRMLDDESLTLRFNWKCGASLKVGFAEMERIRSVQGGHRYRTILDQDDLLGNVTVDVFGVATRDINNFTWAEQNEDYQGLSFNLRQGEVIVIFPGFEFNVEKQYDPLNPPLKDLYSIQRSNRNIRGMEVDLSHPEKIVVFVNERLFDQLAEIGFLPQTLISLIVFPSLIQAVAELKAEVDGGESQGLSETRWGETLLRLISDAGIEDRSAFKIAQQLVEFPISGAVQEIMPKDDDE